MLHFCVLSIFLKGHSNSKIVTETSSRSARGRALLTVVQLKSQGFVSEMTGVLLLAFAIVDLMNEVLASV